MSKDTTQSRTNQHMSTAQWRCAVGNLLVCSTQNSHFTEDDTPRRANSSSSSVFQEDYTSKPQRFYENYRHHFRMDSSTPNAQVAPSSPPARWSARCVLYFCMSMLARGGRKKKNQTRVKQQWKKNTWEVVYTWGACTQMNITHTLCTLQAASVCIC